MAGSDEQTPIMRQYWELKAKNPDALLFYRMGDFYELFGDDAVTASRTLEITLTTRDKTKANPTAMAGVPWHSAQGYIQKLLNSGFKVAIAEQLDENGQIAVGKAIAKRDVVRVLTPGLHFESTGYEQNYLATAIGDRDRFTIACLDIATGDFRFSAALDADELGDELSSLPIRHFLKWGEALPDTAMRALASDSRILVETIATHTLSIEEAKKMLRSQFEIASLDAFIESDVQAHALGVILKFACATQRTNRIAHLKRPRRLRESSHLYLGSKSTVHLNLFPSGDGGANLFDFLNRTRSALGARTLHAFIENPLTGREEIESRRLALTELATRPSVRESMSKLFSTLYDLERICARLQSGLCSPKDSLALGQSLSIIGPLSAHLASLESCLARRMRGEIESRSASLTALSQHILAAQKEDAPHSSKEGGIFRHGFSPDLDRLLKLTENGERELIDFETRERESTGIANLRVKFNRVFGYSIEITNSYLDRVPAHYVRKQTMTGAERYITEELKRFEDELLNASSRQKTLEQKLFEELLDRMKLAIPNIMTIAETLGSLDALLSLSYLCDEPGWVFPTIDESRDLELVGARHPLVDQAMHGSFVPNSLSLSASGPGAHASRKLLIITGPNMGGKSTVMRQSALIVVLGQMGAPIPAQSARWGVVSSIFTRIGASDAITRGQSTFMVEMAELAQIVHRADRRSLILLDEIGRGTSTYDGMSVAWATLEYISAQIDARTLFATHYHELTRLAGQVPGVANSHMAVAETATGELRFLYELRDGPSSESFGIHVAKLAGLPSSIIERAWQILEKLENESARPSKRAANSSLRIDTDQLKLI